MPEIPELHQSENRVNLPHSPIYHWGEKGFDNEESLGAYLEYLKFQHPEIQAASFEELLKSDEGARIIEDSFSKDDFPEQFNTGDDYDNDVDIYSDFKMLIVTKLFQQNPNAAKKYSVNIFSA